MDQKFPDNAVSWIKSNILAIILAICGGLYIYFSGDKALAARVSVLESQVQPLPAKMDRALENLAAVCQKLGAACK